MNPVPVTCPTPAAIWGMDPAIAGAVVGALIAGLAAWGMAWWAEHRNTRQRQLEAVAEFITTTDAAVAAWRATYTAMPSELKDAVNIYRATELRKEELETLIHAHWEAVARLDHGLNVLDLRLTNKKLRKTVQVMRQLATEYTDCLAQIENDMEHSADLVDDDNSNSGKSNVVSLGNLIESVLGKDKRMPFLTAEPFGKKLDEAIGNLTHDARRVLA